MKKIIIILLSVSFSLSAQEPKAWFSVAPAITNSHYLRFIAGGPTRKPKCGFSTSFEYLLIHDKKIDLGFGLSYQLGRVEYVPNMDTPENIIRHTEQVSLFSTSLISSLNLKNERYLKFSPSVDFHIIEKSKQFIDNQSGIGISFSAGKHIKFNDKLLLNIEPRLWIHNIIPFIRGTYPQRLAVLGINFGISL